MNTRQLEAVHGAHHSEAQIGALSALARYQFFHPRGKGKGFPGKLFLKDALAMTGMEVSVNALAPGQGMPFSHTHTAHEELYVFLKGRGQFLIDGTVIEVAEGSVIRVAPEGVRCWRNTSDEDLLYVVVQAMAGSMAATTIEDGVMHPDKPAWPEPAVP